jgi:glycosyltransferase involved in cell wall biosynthesis
MTNADAPSVSVVIPSFNEVGNVQRVALDALKVLVARGLASYEIVLVDDGSTDGTGAAMDSLAARHVAVRVARHERNRGLGAALRTGFAYCRGSLVTWIPGDGQFDLADVLTGLDHFPQRDVVVVLRKGPKHPLRGLITLCFHGLIRLLYRFDATDMCGIFIVKRAVLEQACATSDDVFFNLEVPIACVRQGRSIGQILVLLKPRLSGKSKVDNLRTFLANLQEMLRFRFRRQ